MNADREESLKAHLSAYLDGELSDQERAEVQEWLDQYADARALLDELRATVEALSSLPRAEASGELLAGLRSRLERQALLDELPEFAGEGTPVRMFSVGRWLSAAAVIALSGVALYFTWSSHESGQVDRDRFARLEYEESATPVREESEPANEIAWDAEERPETVSRLARRQTMKDKLEDDEVIPPAEAAEPLVPKAAALDEVAVKAPEPEQSTVSGDDLISVNGRKADGLAGLTEPEAIPGDVPVGPGVAADRMEIRHDLSLDAVADQNRPTRFRETYDNGLSIGEAERLVTEVPVEKREDRDENGDGVLDSHELLVMSKQLPVAKGLWKAVELVYADEADVVETLQMLDGRFGSKELPLPRSAATSSQPAGSGYAALKDVDVYDIDEDGDIGDFGFLQPQTTTAPAGEAVRTLALALPNERAVDDVMDALSRARRRPTQTHILSAKDTRAYGVGGFGGAGLESAETGGEWYSAGKPTTRPATVAENMPYALEAEGARRGRLEPEGASVVDLGEREGGEGERLVNGSFESELQSGRLGSEERLEEAEVRASWSRVATSAVNRSGYLKSAETLPVAPGSQPAPNQAVALYQAVSEEEHVRAVATDDSTSAESITAPASNRLWLYFYVDQSGPAATTRPAASQPSTRPVTTQPASAPARP